MYKQKDKTPSLFPELFPLGGSLDKENRWLKLAALMPWDRLEEVYSKYFKDSGRPAKDARLVCGLLTVKWLESYSDERTVTEFSENPYVQLFCGMEQFVACGDTVEPSVLSRARKKLGQELFAGFEHELAEILETRQLIRKFPAYPADTGVLRSAGRLIDKVARAIFGRRP